MEDHVPIDGWHEMWPAPGTHTTPPGPMHRDLTQKTGDQNDEEPGSHFFKDMFYRICIYICIYFFRYMHIYIYEELYILKYTVDISI